MNFIKKILGVEEEIFLRRIQFNQIDSNCFVGHHLDKDSNPDYIAAIVIQIGKLYKGGIYRVYQKDGSFFDYTSSYGDLIISDCNYREVTKVTEGEENHCIFVSNSNDLNKETKLFKCTALKILVITVYAGSKLQMQIILRNRKSNSKLSIKNFGSVASLKPRYCRCSLIIYLKTKTFRLS